MMDRNTNKTKINNKFKGTKNTNNKFQNIIVKTFNLENEEKLKYKTKVQILSKKRNGKLRSNSSHHDKVKKGQFATGLKNINEKQNIVNIINESKNKKTNNSLAKKNKNSNTKEKKNNIKQSRSREKNSKSNNIKKKKIKTHCSFFLQDFSNKYKIYTNSFNLTSDSLNKNTSISKANSKNKTMDSKNKGNINKSKGKNKNNLKNDDFNGINNIKRIIIKNQNKNKDNKKIYSINSLSLHYNKQIINKPLSRINTYQNSSKKSFSSFSNKGSKEKKSFNKIDKIYDKIEKTKQINKLKFIQKSKYIFESSNNSSPKIMLKKNKNTKAKKPNQKINSRNIRYNNQNFTNMPQMNNNISTIANNKYINNKGMNYIEFFKKNKKTVTKKSSLEKSNTANFSPNKKIEKKDYLNITDISKIIDENNKIKERNENLSMQIIDMAKEFANMKKENIIIKKELQEKTKMIKDMKLTIDIFNQELNKLQNLSKRANKDNNTIQNHNNINIENNNIE